MYRGVRNLIVKLLIVRKLLQMVCEIWPVNHVLGAFKNVSSWWANVPLGKFWKHVITNVLVGLGITVLLLVLHGSPKLRQIEDDSMDWMMSMFRGTSPESPTLTFAFLDIDEKTYRHWGEPFYVPRKDLVKTLQYARQGNPALIFLDVEISHPGWDPDEDAVFRRFVENYPAKAPPLLLVKSFRAGPNDHLEQRGSFLDSAVEQNANVFWASTLFKRDSDQKIRHWYLWTPAYTENGAASPVPSVQLLGSLLLDEGKEGQSDIVAELSHTLAEFQDGRHDSHSRVTLGRYRLTAHADHGQNLGQRIFFSIPYRYSSGEKIPSVRTSQGDESLLIIRHSIFPVVAGQSLPDSSWLKNRVVVIGASFEDSRDVHVTPIGEMPGSMILVNAIHSFWQNGEIEPVPFWVKILIEVLLIVIMSLAFARFSSFWGMFISGASIVMILLPLSFWIFRYGVWLDFALPLVAVQLHQMAADFEESIKEQD